MAELLFTTDAFRPEGRPMPGVPMLLDSSMRLIEPACAWLMHIALVRGRTRSPQTWRSYGEALYDWWQTLEANGWTWDRLGYHEAAAYRDFMLTGPSGRNGRPYARATINLRLRVVALFYHWCISRGLVNRWLRVSGTTEMPQIDQCVGHQFHTVVSLLFELEAQLQPLEFIFPREGPLHA